LSPHRQLKSRLDVRSQPGPTAASRRCYFGPDHGWIDAALISRDSLAGRQVRGPAIIEEDNSATVLNPGWRATLDAWSNIVIESQ
jgi:N-methylhydantoinase A